MRDGFVTPFWRAMFKSLPPAVQRRYLSQLQAAERWDLALDRAVGILSRAAKSLARLLQTPPRSRSAH
jgi:hypothetical protein